MCWLLSEAALPTLVAYTGKYRLDGLACLMLSEQAGSAETLYGEIVLRSGENPMPSDVSSRCG